MNRIPDYESFKKFVTAQITNLKKGYRNGDLVLICMYVLIVLFILIVALGAFIASLGQIGLLKNNIFTPQKQLNYKKESEKINENDKYITNFKLEVSTPQNEFGTMTLFNHPNGCDLDNIKKLDGQYTEFRNGTMYLVSNNIVTCETDKPITENTERDLLFEIKK